ncbi:MAG TPA: CDP-alcohol phosphatidyltransferase family protein [Gemmatimonadales bacterium]|nr:CDP-alcohol phosphatidyltransferase family protein [Gemmatimonadales bacterium]
MATGTRELTFFLAVPERRLLEAIARRLPAWVTSDLLTALGVAGAIVTGVGYALSGHHVLWLLLASGGLAINWFGDSLDGTLARVRQTERPRYGYYLDHIVDAFATAAVGVGIGLSPFMALEIALGLVALYLALSINVYLETAVFGVFRLGYGRLGPTESRLMLVAGNAGVVTAGLAGFDLAGPLHAVTNGLGIVLCAVMAALLVARFGKNLKELARLEPRHKQREPGLYTRASSQRSTVS